MNKTDLDTAQIIATLRDIARRQHADDPRSIMHRAADCISQLKTERSFENEIVVKAAIAAMAAMVAHPNATTWTATEIAHDAVVQADALLEALQKNVVIEELRSHVGDTTKMVRPEPSRLEIAAMFMARNGSFYTAKLALEEADALITAAAKGGAK